MQEVVGDERTALQAVVAADAELMELREEEEELNKQLQDASLEDQPKGFDADEASQRLNEVSCLASLEVVVTWAASTTEPRKRSRITLHSCAGLAHQYVCTQCRVFLLVLYL